MASKNEKQRSIAIVQFEVDFDILNPFGTDQECDRQTDRQTGQTF